MNRATAGAFVIHEDNVVENAHEDVDMDLEDDIQVIPQSEDMEAASERGASIAPIPVEDDTEEMHVEDQLEGDEEEETMPSKGKSPRVWPDLPTAQRMKCERDVQTIREVFDDGEEPYDPTMVTEYAEEIFEYMESLEVSCRCHRFRTISYAHPRSR